MKENNMVVSIIFENKKIGLLHFYLVRYMVEV